MTQSHYFTMVLPNNKYVFTSIVLYCIILISPGTAWSMDDAHAETLSLISMLEKIRYKTIHDVPSGVGTALIEIPSSQANELFQSSASFKFRDNDSIAWLSQGDSPTNKPSDVYLAIEDQRIHYVPPGNQVQSSVTITSEPELSSMSDGLQGWSYKDLMEIPISGGGNDSMLFGVLKTHALPYLTAKATSESHITVTLVSPADPKGFVERDEWILEFDLSIGGVLIKCNHSLVYKDPSHGSLVEQISLDWSLNENGIVLPVQRHLIVSRTIQGKPEQRIENTITFSDFEVKDVRDNELAFEAMNIPIGTPIVDRNLMIDWRYGENIANLELDRIPRIDSEINEPPMRSEQIDANNVNTLPSTDRVNIGHNNQGPGVFETIELIIACIGTMLIIVIAYILWKKKRK